LRECETVFIVTRMNAEDQKAIQEAEHAGFDLSLIDYNLSLSYEARVLQHDSALELMLALRAAGEAKYGKVASSAAATR
jgi:hypothetical protein